MLKKVVAAGVLGGIVLFGWTFVINGIFGFNRHLNMNQISDERFVYDVLKSSIVEPGRYIANPELTPAGIFPDGEPVFSIHYSGMGHDVAGKLMLFQLAIFLLVPVIAAWKLSLANERVLNSYWCKVRFTSTFGLLFALYGDLMSIGIDNYSLLDAFCLAVEDIFAWILVGLVVAWRLQPSQSPLPSPSTA